jgi:AcrR family transcriptional regulator
VSTSARAPYHHGDLRAALIEAANALVEASGEVARRAGVSTAAPYRHFADKDELLAALAVRGYGELGERLARASAGAPDAPLVELAVAYVGFAVDHPGVFRLMYGHPCSRSRAEVSAAAAATNAVFLAAIPPDLASPPFATGGWALAHGLAQLLLDGKLTAPDPAALVRAVVAGTLRTA